MVKNTYILILALVACCGLHAYDVLYVVTDDPTYVELAAASIRSVLRHSGQANVTLHVALSPETDAIGRRQLAQYNPRFYECPIGSTIRTNCSFYSYLNHSRYLWCRYGVIDLVDAPVVMYIDSDTVVQADVAEAFETYRSARFAAVRNCNVKINDLMPSSDDGRCSFMNGVFLTDTEWWRSQNVTARMQSVDLSDVDARMEDTLAANLVLYEHWTPMSPLWNVMGLGNNRTMYNRRGVENAKILHWTGPCKPNSDYCVYNNRDLWEDGGEEEGASVI